MAPLRFTVWSDVLCPWCYVAAVRLEELQRELPVEVTWRSFLLQPEVRPKPLDRFRRYTERWFAPGGPATVEPTAHFAPWRDEAPPSHSVPPAIAVHAAATFGAGLDGAMHRALMEAYFGAHRDVSTRDVVVDVAAAIGIDPGAFAAVLRDRGAALRDAVLADHHAAFDLGITAVPAVVIGELGDAFVIPGAQELETYRRIVRRLAARAAG